MPNRLSRAPAKGSPRRRRPPRYFLWRVAADPARDVMGGYLVTSRGNFPRPIAFVYDDEPAAMELSHLIGRSPRRWATSPRVVDLRADWRLAVTSGFLVARLVISVDHSGQADGRAVGVFMASRLTGGTLIPSFARYVFEGRGIDGYPIDLRPFGSLFV